MVKQVCIPTQERGNEKSYFPGDDLFTPLERKKGLPIGNLLPRSHASAWECRILSQ